MPKAPIVPQPAAQMPRAKKLPQPAAKSSVEHNSLLWLIPWGHHVLLLARVAERADRLWYMQQTLANGWSRNMLALAIDSRAHHRQGKAITNFAQFLPSPQSDLAQQTLKDPYIFDFLTLEEPFRERELESGLVQHLEKFLLELGRGFAFVGRQYRLEVGDEDFRIDLLFYHLRLRSFVVIDLKTGPFKPEYAGKLNFYCNVVNDQLRHPSDEPTIGLILCQSKNRVLAEYALSGIDKPIGVSTYEITRALPARLKSALPTVEEIEAELSAAEAGQAKLRRAPKKPSLAKRPKR
jgi:predicted nuclease of restriction endonuclease-like (RecB) superfamily